MKTNTKPIFSKFSAKDLDGLYDAGCFEGTAEGQKIYAILKEESEKGRLLLSEQLFDEDQLYVIAGNAIMTARNYFMCKVGLIDINLCPETSLNEIQII